MRCQGITTGQSARWRRDGQESLMCLRDAVYLFKPTTAGQGVALCTMHARAWLLDTEELSTVSLDSLFIALAELAREPR